MVLGLSAVMRYFAWFWKARFWGCFAVFRGKKIKNGGDLCVQKKMFFFCELELVAVQSLAGVAVCF